MKLKNIPGGYKAFWENDVYMGEILMDVDGFYKWWPESNGGYLDEYTLYVVFKQLQELNKAWDNQIQNDPNIGLRNDNIQQGESI